MDVNLNYGNWIRKKNLLLLGLSTLAAGVLAILPLVAFLHFIVTALFIVLLISLLFPFYAYIMFSQKGGKLQEKFYDLIIQSVGDKTGKFLDIGSGNGVLAVKLALHLPNTEVVGIDSWGTDWEYSRQICEQNARAAKMDQRVHFQKGDAAALQFADESFDGAVSNLTFHEVASVADKKQVVSEALRVVKRGGHFAFIDYFYDSKYYGNTLDIQNDLTALGLSHFECEPIQNRIHIPMLLRHPRILGKVGILHGQK